MGLIAWLNRDAWSPMWPNLAASALCATAAVLRIRVHLRRHHEAQRLQHDKTRRLVLELHDRLNSIGAETKERS